MKFPLPAVAAFTLMALAFGLGHAATMSASPEAPVIDGEDIANFGSVTGTDKWWTGSSADSAARGQTFTTGDSVTRIKSVTYQISSGQKAEPTKTYAIRLGTVSGSSFSENLVNGSDRVFHLDIERPLGPVFELVATTPPGDDVDVLASRELVLTFSQDVSPGTGNLILRDLTDLPHAKVPLCKSALTICTKNIAPLVNRSSGPRLPETPTSRKFSL